MQKPPQKTPECFICPECGHASRVPLHIRTGYCGRCGRITGGVTVNPSYKGEPLNAPPRDPVA